MSILGKRNTPDPPTIALTLLVQSYNNPQHVREIYHTLAAHALAIRAQFTPTVTVALVILEKGTCTEDELALPPIATPIDVTFHALSNNGREYGAYLWYTSTHYDTLHGHYVFTSANLPKHDRRKRLSHALALSTTLIAGQEFPLPRRSGRTRKGKHGVDYSYVVEEYMGQEQTPAEVRPFGAWFERCVCPQEDVPFHDTWRGQTDGFSNGVVVGTGAKMKARLSKAAWQELYDQTERGGNAPEVGHYLEKASYWLWAPYPDEM